MMQMKKIKIGIPSLNQSFEPTERINSSFVRIAIEKGQRLLPLPFLFTPLLS